MRRTVKKLLAALAVLAASIGVVVWTAPAAYAIDLCKDVPAPRSPKDGLAGLLTIPPSEPATGDPFAPGSTVPIADVYGVSWGWSAYDLGCVSNPLTDTAAVVNTGSGNRILDVAGGGVAIMTALERIALEPGTTWLTEWGVQASEAVRPVIVGGQTPNGFMLGLLPLGLIVLAIGTAWVAREGNLAKAGHAFVLAFICVGLAGFAFAVPGAASQAMDRLALTSADVGGSVVSTSLTDGVTRQSIYRAWLSGNFGDPDGDLARTYGPRLLDATHYTWAEWERIEADPAAREGIDAEKEAEFREVAEIVKEQGSPAAYAQLQGHGERTGPALFGLVVAIFSGLFAYIAYFMVINGRIVLQMVPIVGGFIAVAAVVSDGERRLRQLWDLFLSALIAIAKFMFAAGLMAMVFGLVSALDPVSALLLMFILTIAALKILRPGHAFKAMIPGMDPNRSYLKDLVMAAARLIASALTGGVAGAAGAVVAGAVDDRGPRDVGDLTVNTKTHEVHSAPALPAPTVVQLDEARQRPGLEGPAGPRGPAPVHPGPQGPWPQLPGAPAGSAPGAPALPPGAPTPPATPEPVTVRPVVNVQPVQGGGQGGSTVIEGEVLDGTSTYRRPAAEPPRPIGPVDVGRDRGTDAPNQEIALYRSHKTPQPVLQ